MLVVVEVLEETLCVKTVAQKQLLESINDIISEVPFDFIGVCSSIDSLSPCIIQYYIYSFFKSFLGKDLIHCITEISPPDVLALFGSLEVGSYQIELTLRQDDFSHIESYSELCHSDVSASEFIKVSEEFSNSDSLFLAAASDPCNAVVHIIWLVTHDFVPHITGLILGEILE